MSSPINTGTYRTKTFKNPPGREQELVQLFFGARRGLFVDVGANDPSKDSQSWHLEKLGWDGLLIEPLPECVAELTKKRKARVVAVACSSPINHGKKMRLQLAGTHSTLENSPIAIGGVSQGYVEVDSRTLDSILVDHGMSTAFELLSIDVEGHELEVFKGFDIRRWNPQLVLLEDHVINHAKHRWMEKNGYKLILRTGLNSWYVPVSAGWSLSFWAKLQMFRKYWLGLLPRKLKFSKL